MLLLNTIMKVQQLFQELFENFHGIKPSQVTKLSKLKNFPRIIFNENITITQELEYNIIKKEEFIFYALGIKTDNKKNRRRCSKIFL